MAGCCLWLLVLPAAVSQQLSPKVSAAAGASANLPGGGYMAWTVGETVIFTGETASHFMTQGFHQPDWLLTAVEEAKNLPWQAALSPNPAGSFIEMSVLAETPADWTAALYAADGRFLGKQSATAARTTFRFEVGELAPGLYFLTLTSGGRVGAYRFVKQ